MPLTTEQQNAQLAELLKFVANNKNQQSVATAKDIPILDNNLKTIAASLLKGNPNFIIEALYFDDNKKLVVDSLDKLGEITSAKSNINLTLNSDHTTIDKNNPLIIIKIPGENQGLVYKVTQENGKNTLKFLGLQSTPAILNNKEYTNLTEISSIPSPSTSQIPSSSTAANDVTLPASVDNETPPETLNDVNIVKTDKEEITLSFSKDGDCYLHFGKTKKNVGVEIAAAKDFKNFVKNNCPKDGKMYILIDQEGKIQEAYTLDKNNYRKQLSINKELAPQIEKVINAATQLNSTLVNAAADKLPTNANPPAFDQKTVNQCNNNVTNQANTTTKQSTMKAPAP